MTHLGSDDQQPHAAKRRRWRRWVIAALFVAVVATGGTVWWQQRQQDTCEDWSAELTTAIEDGSLADGSFEPSEACREQMRHDLDEVSGGLGR